MSKHVAIMTFGILREDLDEASLAEFNGIDEQIIATSLDFPGFVNNAESAVQWELGKPRWQQDYGAWGKFTTPKFYTYPPSNSSPPTTQILSVWENVDAVKHFAYSALHGTALARRTEWYQKGDWPNHVMWYIDPETTPQWADGCARLEKLAAEGPSQDAFSFPNVYSPEGEALCLAG